MSRYEYSTRAARFAMVALVSIPAGTPAAEPPAQASTQNYRALCADDLGSNQAACEEDCDTIK